MKLYMHPVSTVSRPVTLFAADEGIDLEPVLVDIFTGAQYGEDFLKINPSHAVPVLEDGDLCIGESSAILKYLADKTGSAAYPKDLKQRARVNALMDWFNTGFYRSFGYNLCYSQLLDHCKLPDENAQRLVAAAGETEARQFLDILDRHTLGRGNPYLAGNDITIADYFASGIVSLGDVIGCTFADWPNVQRWYRAMQARPNWEAANGALAQWADMAKGPDFVRV
ncbi:MAG: glutathione S-transferase family protein [Alphaproteobacteria bacterium]|nr:glutathione S-transferase family protein [Alphaproteobacteria bacterium]MCB9931315.1 glutathione S-transferase family protein [Alphaproteobacteria bacterium]